MDVGLIIIAATFGLLIVSLVTFVSSLVKARRLARFAGDLQEVEHAVPGTGGPMDTSLEGLTVEVSADSPSAALLTPLRAGEWMPPDEPAPAERLEEASLAERIAGFEPSPRIPEPDFNIEHYEPWEVEPATPDVPVNPTPAASSLPLSMVVPQVGIADASGAPVAVAGTSNATDDDLDRELAALMPTTALSPVEAAVASSTAQHPAIDTSQPVATPVPAVMPAPAPPQLAAPTVMPEPHPEPDVTPAAAAITIDEPAPLPVVAEPPVETVPAAPAPAVVQPLVAPLPVVAEPPVEPVPAAPAPAVVQPPEPEVYWEDLLREQQDAASPRAQTRTVEPRPEVRVVAAEPPPVAVPPVPAARPRPVRPVTRVRNADGEVREFAPAEIDRAEGSPADSRRSASELVMEAPVEMWFGDSRVGVKAGTATYDRFRKYADVLLGDLKTTKGRSA